MEENTETKTDVATETKAKAEPERIGRQQGPRLDLPGSLQEIVGSLLFASESPLTVQQLRECVRGVEPEEGDNAEVMEVYRTCTTREIEAALRGVEKALEVARCGFRLVCTGGTYRLQTTPVCGRYVRALLKLDRPSRLSRASLETLAIVAYRQPVTKAEIEEIRGVGVDTILKTLSELQLVRLVGRSELPGHPFLYGTTPFFLEHFGLASLDQLNDIDPTLPRSNPRARAELFKKKEKPKPEQLTLDGEQPTANATKTPPENAGETPPAAENENNSPAEPADGDLSAPGEAEEGDEPRTFRLADDDEDSEDELDELDEDDEEDEEDEDEGEEDELDEDEDDEGEDEEDEDEGEDEEEEDELDEDDDEGEKEDEDEE